MIERESHEDRVLAAFMVLVIAGAIAWGPRVRGLAALAGGDPDRGRDLAGDGLAI
jgi:hypothetical protein